MKMFPTCRSLSASILLLLSGYTIAAPADLRPSIEFTTGLTGSQTRLSWPAIPGAHYRILSCTDLSASAGAGAWRERSVVVPTGTDGFWVDPEPTGVRAFYSIEIPAAEVFSVSPAVISSGSTLIIKAQCLPDGCSIVFDFGGTPPVLISAPLVPDGPGQYRAVVANSADSGEQWVKAAKIVDPLGATVVVIGQTFEIAASGFAADTPPTMPPALSERVRSKTSEAENNLGAISKKMHGAPKIGEATAVFQSLPGEVCFQECDLSVAVPAGPPLNLVRTYRSMQHGGTAAHWEHCFDVRIEPMPMGSGVNATCILLFTGDGRRDVLLRQADGSFSADGMFRTGVFKPDTSFELTFADHAKFIFCPLVGAPWRGRIGSIEDKNGVALTCAYSAVGKLTTISSQFGQSLSFDYDSTGNLGRVTDQTSRFVSYTYFAQGETGGNPGDLKSVSCPQLPGQAAIQGPTTYTYSTGFTDARRNRQLLSMRDGAGRLVCACTYSTSSNAADADFARCVTMDCDRVLPTDAPMTFSYAFLPPSAGFAGGLRCTSCDEVGRVVECDFDKQWRCVRMAEFTGFATPGVPVTAASNRPTAASKLRSTDPAMYVTTCDYNADHCCTVCTEEDGLQTITTYARELTRNCPVLERGNARLTTLRSPFGEERTVSCDFLAGFGTCEAVIGFWLSKKGYDYYKAKSDLNSAHASNNPYFKNNANAGEMVAMSKLTKADAGFWDNAQVTGATTEHRDAEMEKWEGVLTSAPRKGGMVNGSINVANSPACKPGGPVKGLSFNPARKGSASVARKFASMSARAPSGYARTVDHSGDPHEYLDGGISAWDDWEAPVVRMTTSLGQVHTWGYDAHGNCTSRTAPVGGGTCIRNPFGQVTRLSVNNGTTPLVNDISYDQVTKFCSSVIQDPTGLALTVSCERDALKRINRVIDERGNDALITYNACDQPVIISSPAVGTDALNAARITCTQFYDAGGLPVRCDMEHRDAAGALVAANPAYTGFCIYDVRGRLVAEACEQKPVNFPIATLVPTAVDLQSCDVCNYTLNAAGECIRVSKPAASIGQMVDLTCDYRFDERGLLFRSIEGGLGTADAVTTECSYTMYGIMKACSTLADAPLVSPTVSCTYDGFRRLQSCTDEMGNVTECAYDNKGFVTCSVYGEVVDVPGGAGNVLLSRSSSRTYTGGRFALELNGVAIPKFLDYMKKGKRSEAELNLNAINRTNQPIVTRDVADITDHAINTQGTGAPKGRMAGGNPFFDFDETDAVCVVERFTPGQTTPPALETTTLHYSPAGLLLSEVCNSDTLNTFAHDTAGRLTTCTKPGVCSTVCTLDACGNPTVCVVTAFSTIAGTAAETFTTIHQYDALGRLISYRDQANNPTTCDFDSLSRTTRCVQPGGLVTTCDFDTLSASTGEFSSCTVTQTSPLGLVLSTTRCVCLGGVCSSQTDALGYTTTYACDSQGRCVLTTNPDTTTESCTFDKLGHPVSRTRKNGAIIAADFNYKGRCISTTCDHLPTDVVPVPATSYVYSGLDDCVQLTQGASVISRTFDSCGNEVSETQNGSTVTRMFSHRGRTGIVYATGERFSEARNAQGQLVSVSSVTATGQVLVPAISAREYSGLNCVKETRSNGVVTTYDFRSDGEAAIGGSSSIPLVPDFSFGTCVRTGISNAQGGTIEVAVTRRNADQCVTQTVNNFGGPARVHNFTLDARNLVTGSLTRFRDASTAPLIIESEVSYVLDARGQRVSTSGGTRPGSYVSDGGEAAMGQYSKWPGGPLTWDDNGCLTDLSRGATGLHLIYDAYSRLVEVQSASGGSIASYGYDACDRRISSTIAPAGPTPTVTVRFRYDASTCIQETDGSDVPQRTYACASGIGICIVPINGDPIYPHGTGTNINTTESSLKDIPPAACMGDTSSGRLRVWQLMQGETGSQAMRWTPLVPKPQHPYRMCFTSSTGSVSERVDCDDAGQPIFLAANGSVRVGATATLSRYDWIKPAWDKGFIWCPESGLIQGPDGVYSPELGRSISAHCDILIDMKDQSLKKNYVGHVTLIKQ